MTIKNRDPPSIKIRDHAHSDNVFTDVTTGVKVLRPGPAINPCPGSLLDVALRNNRFVYPFTDAVVTYRAPEDVEAPVDLGTGASGETRGMNAFEINEVPPPGVRAIANEGTCATLMARGNYFGPIVPPGLISGAVDTTGSLPTDPGSMVVPVEPIPTAQRILEVGGASPNPTAAGTSLSFNVPGDGTKVSIEVVDVLGRLVRGLGPRDLPRGSSTIDWDGRDRTGRPVANGLYFVRVMNERKTAGVVRVIVAR